jgi:SET domain-containing protein
LSVAAGGSAAVPPKGKKVVWQRSSIHGAGLFAAERIAAGEFVIEYVGMLIRPVLEDVVEARYERQGQESSYLFRWVALELCGDVVFSVSLGTAAKTTVMGWACGWLWQHVSTL